MAVQLMNPDRERVDLNTASPEQFKAATLGFLAYSGTYTVNVAQGIVAHHVDCALDPADLGTDKARHFALAGDLLTITLGPRNGYGAVVQSRTLVWKRLH
jgi:hypothetical protein